MDPFDPMSGMLGFDLTGMNLFAPGRVWPRADDHESEAYVRQLLNLPAGVDSTTAERRDLAAKGLIPPVPPKKRQIYEIPQHDEHVWAAEAWVLAHPLTPCVPAVARDFVRDYSTPAWVGRANRVVWLALWPLLALAALPWLAKWLQTAWWFVFTK